VVEGRERQRQRKRRELPGTSQNTNFPNLFPRRPHLLGRMRKAEAQMHTDGNRNLIHCRYDSLL
jgi:hypothetical protein